MNDHPNADLLKRKLKIAWVDVAHIIVDPIAQRQSLDYEKVNRIVRDFDPHLFEALRLNKRGPNEYACMEGGHRLRSAELKNIRWVPAVVTEDHSGIGREGKTFLGINKGRKVVSGLDTHRVGVTMREPEALAIQEAVDAFGLVVGRGQGGRTVSALRPMKNAIRRDNLLEVLEILSTAWGCRDKNGFDGILIEGVSILLSAYPGQVDERDLASRLGAQAAILVRKRAVEKKEATGSRPGTSASYAMVDLYNHRRRGGRLDPTQLTEWASPIARGKRSARTRHER